MPISNEAFDEQELEEVILGFLPDDGTPVLNRVMRARAGAKLEAAIDEDAFFAARDRLLSRGLIGRLRGPGGLLYRTSPKQFSNRGADPVIQREIWSEARLMEPLGRYLDGPFRKALNIAETSYVIEDTSVGGQQRGRWARADFILVSAMRYKFLPGAQIDVHSFELKTEAGGGVLAIHEALAQTRWSHFGHFVWHIPRNSKAELLISDVELHCKEHGIGLIRMFDPDISHAEGGCEILVDPKRKATTNITIDGYLETALSSTNQKIILRATGMLDV